MLVAAHRRSERISRRCHRHPWPADFLLQAQSALRVADDQELPRLIFLNKLGREEVDVEGTMEQVRERFGRQAVALQNAGPSR